jgi:hypothetical protein
LFCFRSLVLPAQWDITCEECSPIDGNICNFSPSYYFDNSTTAPLCASVPSDQYGELYLKDCHEFVSPPDYEQLFYFGTR